MNAHRTTPRGLYDRMTRRNLFLPDTLVEQLKVIADKHKITMAELIRQVLTDYVHG